MASGVTIDPSVDKAVGDMIAKKGERVKVLVLTMSEGNDKIVVDEHRTRLVKDFKDDDDVFKQVMDLLEKDRCCYAVYDCFYLTREGSEKEELVMISWCPEGSSIKEKMLYTASWKTLRGKFNGIKHQWQMCDDSDKCQDDLTDKFGTKGCVAKLEGRCCMAEQQHQQQQRRH